MSLKPNQASEALETLVREIEIMQIEREINIKVRNKLTRLRKNTI